MAKALFPLAVFLIVSSAAAFQWKETTGWVAREGDTFVDLTFNFTLDPGETLRRIAWFKNTSQGMHTLVSYVPASNHKYINYTFRNGTDASGSTGTLSLQDVRLEDGGNYLCILKIESGSSEEISSGILWVRGQPKRPTTLAPVNAFTEGDDATLTCESKGSTSRPVNTSSTFLYQWFKDSSPVTGTWQRQNFLTLQNVSKTYEGNYACAVQEDVDKGLQSQKSESIRLQVNVALMVMVRSLEPRQQTTAGVVKVTENSSLILTCEVPAENRPEVVLQWFRKRMDQVSGERLQTGRNLVITDSSMGPAKQYTSHLNVSGIAKDQAGWYVCEARKGSGRKLGYAHPGIKVDVMYLRDVTVTMQNRNYVMNGEKANFICQVDGSPETTLAWFKDDVELTLLGNRSTATIVPDKQCGTNLNMECRASIDAFGLLRSAEVNVPVECAPNLHPDSDTATVWEGFLGQERVIPFKFRASPTPSFDVLEMDKSFRVTNETYKSSVAVRVTIPSLMREHERTYAVKVWNTHGSFIHNFSIRVHGPEENTPKKSEGEYKPIIGIWTTLGVVLILSAACFIITVIVYIGRRRYHQRRSASKQGTARQWPPETGRTEADGRDSVSSVSRSLRASGAFSNFPDVCRDSEESRNLIHHGPRPEEDETRWENPYPMAARGFRLYPTLPVEDGSYWRACPTEELKLQTRPGAISRPLPPPPLPIKQRTPPHLSDRCGLSSASPYMYMGPLHADGEFRSRTETLDISQIVDDNISLPASEPRLQPSAPWPGPPQDGQFHAQEENSSLEASFASNDSASAGVFGPVSAEGSDSSGDAQPAWISFPPLVFLGIRRSDISPALTRDNDLMSAARSSHCPPAANTSAQSYDSSGPLPRTLTYGDRGVVGESTANGRARVPPPIPPKPPAWSVFDTQSEVARHHQPEGQGHSWAQHPPARSASSSLAAPSNQPLLPH